VRHHSSKLNKLNTFVILTLCRYPGKPNSCFGSFTLLKWSISGLNAAFHPGDTEQSYGGFGRSGGFDAVVPVVIT